jgi:hypothetical protein
MYVTLLRIEKYDILVTLDTATLVLEEQTGMVNDFDRNVMKVSSLLSLDATSVHDNRRLQ